MSNLECPPWMRIFGNPLPPNLSVKGFDDKINKVLFQLAGGNTEEHVIRMSRKSCWQDVLKLHGVGQSTVDVMKDLFLARGIEMPFHPQFRFGRLRRSLYSSVLSVYMSIFRTETIRRKLLHTCPVVNCLNQCIEGDMEVAAHFGIHGGSASICDEHECCNDFVEEIDICRCPPIDVSKIPSRARLLSGNSAENGQPLRDY